MKSIITTLGAVALTATAAQAGGIDRSRLSYGVLFEKGNYIEFGVSHVSPTVKGTYANPSFGTTTGDMANDYTTLSFAYKRDVSDKIAYGIFINQPYGADASYSQGLYDGLNAEWDSKQVAVVMKYKVTPNFSVYGGLKAVRSQATIQIPDSLIRGGLGQAAAAGSTSAAAILTALPQAGISGAVPANPLVYNAAGPADTRVAGIVGVAYEKPEIALRVGLTYESGFTHDFAATETSLIPGIGRTASLKVKMPETITLDFQSGVAKDTLVFGSIRYANWSTWEVRPSGYDALTNDNITDFSDNVISYQLGVGRKLNDAFSVFARVGYEKGNGGISSRLAPTDGTRSFGLGGTYTKDNMKVTAGLEYVKLGDATDGTGTVFKGSKAVGFGMTVGYRF
jgi:long-subunit fatty acid transport protein